MSTTVSNSGNGRGRAKKDGRFVNAKVRADIHQLLEEYCDVYGQTKTVAIERAIESYCLPKLESRLVEES